MFAIPARAIGERITLEDDGSTLEPHAITLEHDGLTLKRHGTMLEDDGSTLKRHGTMLEDRGTSRLDARLIKPDDGRAREPPRSLLLSLHYVIQRGYPGSKMPGRQQFQVDLVLDVH